MVWGEYRHATYETQYTHEKPYARVTQKIFLADQTTRPKRPVQIHIKHHHSFWLTNFLVWFFGLGVCFGFLFLFFVCFIFFGLSLLFLFFLFSFLSLLFLSFLLFQVVNANTGAPYPIHTGRGFVNVGILTVDFVG